MAEGKDRFPPLLREEALDGRLRPDSHIIPEKRIEHRAAYYAPGTGASKAE
jgi:hypothetical protein